MSARLIDLSIPSIQLPESVIIDTSVLIAVLLRSVQDQHRAGQSVAELDAFITTQGRQFILIPTIYSELLHASIRLRYQQELRLHRQAITSRYGHRITSWTELYKRDPSILRGHVTELERLRLTLLGRDFLIAKPENLGPLPSRRSFDEHLIHLIGRFRLDTNDALILLEASRLGVSAIVTMDQDMARATPDFDVYLWR